MRAVLDTNVLISGQFWHGAPHQLLAQIRVGRLSLILSPDLLAEFENVVGRRKFELILKRSGRSKQRVISEMRQISEMVEAPPLATPVCRDPDDDMVLALARTARVDMIVSGDSDLLEIGSYSGIPIITAAEALKQIIGTGT